MSKNYRVNYAQYVHEFVDTLGVTRFAVGVLHPDGSITRPAGRVIRETTGAVIETFPSLQAIGGWTRRTSAIRQANYLFGERDGIAIINAAMTQGTHGFAQAD